MFDDFIWRALVAGVGVALLAGPLGCCIVWQRMSYFGSALSHSALLGVAVGLWLQINVTLSILVFSLLLAALLALLQRRRTLATDTLLGILAHGGLALGLVVLALLPHLRVDLMGFLFGDILAVTKSDLVIIGISAVLVLALVWKLWPQLLIVTVNEDLARVEGFRVGAVKLIFVSLVSAVIAVGMKLVGVLLIISLLVVPPAAARPLARTPDQMALIACAIGALAVAGGLWSSVNWDIPAGPAIVVVATGIFALNWALPLIRQMRGASAR